MYRLLVIAGVFFSINSCALTYEFTNDTAFPVIMQATNPADMRERLITVAPGGRLQLNKSVIMDPKSGPRSVLILLPPSAQAPSIAQPTGFQGLKNRFWQIIRHKQS